ncbi:AlpA family transcriptional regulator [Bibersteinia trehalosi]|uniref:helix-turn-helix transcriptional regulator n=1 Tax=Bibersteinia trehalosi TaxID=47735 RepID=UPI00104A5106|nr:AlpA family phage regulatory protein [Bibersteinia trehalosi]TCT13718.1 AlpA family transcriptional regulator [Bibersteinia trehalosi]
MEQHPPKQRFMKIEEVSTVTTLSETQIYRKMKAGDFPQNISIGANSKVWLESEIQQWITEQITKNRNQ